MTKPFSFTYSKLSDYEQCGLKHQQATILKRPDLAPGGDAIDYGNRVHEAFKNALKDDQPLPIQMQYLQYWVDWVKSLPGIRHTEIKWGLTRDFQPVEFRTNMAWMRFIADVAVVHGSVGWLIDWKTGKRIEEPLQLWLGAACMFAQFSELEVVDSMFIWLKEDDGKNSHECISAETLKRSDVGEIWDQLLPRISVYEDAVASDTFFPKPGYHCRWCRVGKDVCEFSGVRQ